MGLVGLEGHSEVRLVDKLGLLGTLGSVGVLLVELPSNH